MKRPRGKPRRIATPQAEFVEAWYETHPTAKRLTYQEIGDKVGVSHSTITRYFTTQPGPTKTRFDSILLHNAICDAIGFDHDTRCRYFDEIWEIANPEDDRFATPVLHYHDIDIDRDREDVDAYGKNVSTRLHDST